jgi:hypothetical protein
MAASDQAELDNLMQYYMAVLAPKGEFEKFLVEMMVHARWTLTRVMRLERSGKLKHFDHKPSEQSYRRAHRELTRIRKRPQPLGPGELKTLDTAPLRPEFPDMGDFALRS